MTAPATPNSTTSTSRSSQLLLMGMMGLGLTLLFQFLLLIQEVPVSVMRAPNGEIEAYQAAYNLVEVVAPPARTGRMLQWTSYLVTRSFLSPWILRFLLNQNGAPLVRAFAQRYCYDLPPVTYPLHRASVQDIQAAQEWTNNNPNVLQNGFDLQQQQDKTTTTSTTSTSTSSQSRHRYRSIMDYHRLYQSQKAKPSQVLERWLDGAQHHLEHLRIFASPLIVEDIRAQATASSARWDAGRPLSVFDGVPIAMKDQSPVKGHPLCDGSSECTPPQVEDDIPAARLRAAGAILVGMTVMTEGGVTPLGYNAWFDGPFNPYSFDHYSGGSSSGSAVAVASGLVPMAVGWDGGGSIRVPASMSGVVGLAVTFSRIPFERSGYSTVVKAGPLAATVTDAALSYLVLSVPHPEAFYTDLMGGSAFIPLPHLKGVVDGDTVVAPSSSSSSSSSSPSPSLAGIRLGVYWDHFRHTDQEVHSKCSQVVDFLQSKGARIVNITIPHLRELSLSHGFKILSEFGYTWETRFYNTSYKMEANTDITVMLGRTLTAAEMLAIEKVRSFGLRFFEKEIFGSLQLDAVVSPMLGRTVPKPRSGYRGYGESDTSLVYQVNRFVPLANFLGLPAMSIPIGYEEQTGLPIGFQLLGNAWNEAKLIRIASVVDTFHDRRTPPSENYFDVLAPWL